MVTRRPSTPNPQDPQQHTGDDVGPCRHCGHLVATTSAQCRYCGFDADPERNRVDRFVWGLSGVFLVLTVVGAPLGLLFCWKAAVHHRSGTGSVVEPRMLADGGASRVVDDLRRTTGSLLGKRRKQS